MMRVTLPAFGLCVLASLVGFVCSTTTAGAGEPEGCVVRLFPPGAEDAWRAATKRLEERIRTLPQASTDCREISVDVAEGHASLTFVTRDGRRAVRAVSSPDELVPTVEALFVTLPPAAPPPPPASATTSSVPPRLAEAPASSANPVDQSGPAIVLGVAGGARLGLPGAFAAPTVSVGAGVTIGHWDIALRGEWDAANAVLGSSPPSGFHVSGWSAALTAGRREPIGGAALTLGVLAGLSGVAWEVPDTSQSNAQGTSGNGSQSSGTSATTGSKIEPRVGLYFGAAIPRRARIRFHPELFADVVASRVGSPLALDPAFPSLPWWSAGLTLGVEWELR